MHKVLMREEYGSVNKGTLVVGRGVGKYSFAIRTAVFCTM